MPEQLIDQVKSHPIYIEGLVSFYYSLDLSKKIVEILPQSCLAGTELSPTPSL